MMREKGLVQPFNLEIEKANGRFGTTYMPLPGRSHSPRRSRHPEVRMDICRDSLVFQLDGERRAVSLLSVSVAL
jgi:hypothetical protein